MPYCKERLDCKHFDPAGCDAEVGTGCFEERDSPQAASESVSAELPSYVAVGFTEDEHEEFKVLGKVTLIAMTEEQWVRYKELRDKAFDFIAKS